MASDPTCPIIKSLVLLDSEGKRIAVKYYSSEWRVNADLTDDSKFTSGGYFAGR